MRKANNQQPNDEDARVIGKRELSDIWLFGKDGKGYFGKLIDPK